MVVLEKTTADVSSKNALSMTLEHEADAIVRKISISDSSVA